MPHLSNMLRYRALPIGRVLVTSPKMPAEARRPCERLTTARAFPEITTPADTIAPWNVQQGTALGGVLVVERPRWRKGAPQRLHTRPGGGAPAAGGCGAFSGFGSRRCLRLMRCVKPATAGPDHKKPLGARPPRATQAAFQAYLLES